MVYRPTGRARIRYPPVPSLVVVRAWLVSTLVALIIAPATTAPVGSWTVPRIEPVTSALSPSQVVMKRISRVVTGPASKVRRSFILSPFVSVAAHTPTAKMRSRMPQRELGIKQYRRGRRGHRCDGRPPRGARRGPARLRQPAHAGGVAVPPAARPREGG